MQDQDGQNRNIKISGIRKYRELQISFNLESKLDSTVQQTYNKVITTITTLFFRSQSAQDTTGPDRLLQTREGHGNLTHAYSSQR